MSDFSLQLNDLFNIPSIEDEVNDLHNDSFGSCCSSPTQTTDSCSPVISSQDEDSGNECFFFPAQVKLECEEISNQYKNDKVKRKTETKIKRNERERRRVRRLAEGFKKLKTVVPGDSVKLSKLETLKMALDYIKTLSETLEQQQQHEEYAQQMQIVPNVPQPTPWLPSPPQLQSNWCQYPPYAPASAPMYPAHTYYPNMNNTQNVMFHSY